MLTYCFTVTEAVTRAIYLLTQLLSSPLFLLTTLLLHNAYSLSPVPTPTCLHGSFPFFPCPLLPPKKTSLLTNISPSTSSSPPPQSKGLPCTTKIS